jgi:hypothetical protein
MKRTFLALLLAVVPALGSAQPDQRVVKPEIRVGDSWTYRGTNALAPGTHEYENRVSFASEKVILLITTRKGDGKEVDSSWTSEWNATTSHAGYMFQPNSGMFRFPLRVGDKHEFTFKFLRPRVETIENSTTGSTTVVGWEMVEVPAGKFRAIKLEVDTVVQPLDGSLAYPRRVTFWYVPDVRRWVKLQVFTPRVSSSEELLAYKLNED